MAKYVETKKQNEATQSTGIGLLFVISFIRPYISLLYFINIAISSLLLVIVWLIYRSTHHLDIQ